MKLKLSLLTLLTSLSIFSQNFVSENPTNPTEGEKRILDKNKQYQSDSLSKLNYLNRTYKYLDTDFKINIPKDTFDFAVKKYKFYKERIKKYKDSLTVVMVHEFSGNEASRFATLRIGYTWRRLAYHLWISEEESKILGNKNNFNHPYKLKTYIENDTIQTQQRKNIIKDLKSKMFAEGFYKLDTFPNTRKLLNFALRENPERKSDFEKVSRKRKN
jgi:hypothetical protein